MCNPGSLVQDIDLPVQYILCLLEGIVRGTSRAGLDLVEA